MSKDYKLKFQIKSTMKWLKYQVWSIQACRNSWEFSTLSNRYVLPLFCIYLFFTELPVYFGFQPLNCGISLLLLLQTYKCLDGNYWSGPLKMSVVAFTAIGRAWCIPPCVAGELIIFETYWPACLFPFSLFC